ncbi:MAG: hypothetical protein HY868_18740 [Chloroflexi bacterium]|nr:hypothetical protein [Chloroflexota bacterium]
MCAAIAFVALLALFAPSARVDAQAGGQGKLEGQIVNGTKDAKLQNPSSLVVTLYSAVANASTPISQTTKSDNDGKFVFASLDTNAGTRYLLTTTYLGVDYASDVFTFAANQTTVTQTLQVHDTTTDRASLQVMQTHLVIDVQPRILQIVQIVQVVNMSDRAIIHAGPHDPTLIVPTLAKAQAFQFDSPTVESTTLVGDGVITYTLPFAPGVDQIVFNYTVPYTPPTYDFRLALPFDTPTLRILLSDVKANVQSSQLGATSLFPTQSGQTFLQTTASSIKAGTEVRATFSNLTGAGSSATAPSGGPVSAPTGQDNNTLIAGVVLGVVGIAALGLIGFAITRRRAAQFAEDEEYEEEEEEAPASTDSQRLELLQKLADLDDEFEAGKIAQEEYKQQRDAIKAELRELMQAKDAETKE